jgi:hypothetical protein
MGAPITPRLTQGHRRFIKHYTGRDPALAWNATRSYMAAYKSSNDRSASVGGSRLLQNPLVKVIIEKATARLDEKIVTDASFVLEQSRRLYDCAIGDEPVPGDAIITVDPDTGAETVTVPQVRQYDPATARQALQLIGQHKSVQAFTVTIEHSHTHVLEQRLAARSKVIEGMAGAIDADPILIGAVPVAATPGQDDPPGQDRPAPGHQGRAIDDAGAPIDAPGTHQPLVGPANGGQRDPDPATKRFPRVSAGAPAK